MRILRWVHRLVHRARLILRQHSVLVLWVLEGLARDIIIAIMTDTTNGITEKHRNQM